MNFLTSSRSFGGSALIRSASSFLSLSFISCSNRTFHSLNESTVTLVPAVLIAEA